MKFLGGGWMPGRHAQPIELLQANGRKHLTKAEIEHRKSSEIKFGDKKLKCPDFVKNDAEAYKKWKEVTKLYKDVDFVASGDAGLLARYCMTFSEYLGLIELKRQVNQAVINWNEYEQFFPLDFRDGINRILKVDPILQLETAINKKMDMLIKMEDRLFLNPLAKVKNIPPMPKEEEVPSKFAKFGAGNNA